MKDKINTTTELSTIISAGTEMASRKGSQWVYPEHLALALAAVYCGEKSSPFNVESSELSFQIGGNKLDKIVGDINAILSKRPIKTQDNPVPNQSPMMSVELSKILDNAGDGKIGTADFMISLLKTDTELARLFKDVYKLNPKDLEKEDEVADFMKTVLGFINDLSGETGGVPKMKRLDQNSPESDKDQISFGFDLGNNESASDGNRPTGPGNEDEDERTEEEKILNSEDPNVDPDLPFLSKYGHDLVKDAKNNRFDPMVGRESELQELMEILSCRKKNNALLLGDPGTGKTSIIEGLAQRISTGNVPVGLMGKRLFGLDLNSLVAGTKYRGQYEERLQGVIKDVTKNKDIIVYIDEFHNLVGNGGSRDSGDGANILKPYLARGEFQCIGATTSSEYKKVVEKDGALKRRFQNIRIFQPSPSETVDILRQIKDRYEEFHGVTYSDDILKDCVDLSGRYITDRFFPDKAIDILDMSGARAKLDSSSQNPTKVLELEAKLKETQTRKAEAVKEQRFLEAADIRDEEKQVLAELEAEKNVSGKHEPVTREIVSKVIEKITGVPSSKIGQSDMERLRSMKGSLENVVIGQPEAIKETVTALQRNALGLRDPGRPIASLMLLGPTGSGKTYLCKTIATEFFGTPDALIRFDMSEFSEKHEITKLLGSTASYVGYDDEPLFEKVRNRPYSVVLFDEIEKAAPEIYQVFLNILDEGSITLGNGVKVDFRNCIIAFTGNIGTKELGMNKAGFGGATGYSQTESESITMKALKKQFSPEFINRLSKVVVFRKLDDTDLEKICRLEINKLVTRMSSQNYTLEVTDDIIKKIVSECDKTYGARDLQRGIVKNIEEPICNKLLEAGVTGKNIRVKENDIEVWDTRS